MVTYSGPRRQPKWWGAGICVDPKSGETFVGGGDGVPVPVWPKGVPMPNASEMPKRRSPRLEKGSPSEDSTPANNKDVPNEDEPRCIKRCKMDLEEGKNRMRKPSERIIKKKLSASFPGPGDSSQNAMEL